MSTVTPSGPSGELNGARLEALLSQLHDAVTFVDPSGHILLTNRSDEHAPLAPAVPSTDPGDGSEIFHPDGRAYESARWPVFRSQTTGEVVVDEEFFRLEPDGSRSMFSASSMPILGADGRIVAAALITRDISEQKRAREQLAYLLPMLDQTEDAIIAFDTDWHVTGWNKGSERLYGRSAEEALGRELRSFAPVDMSDEQQSTIRREVDELGRWRGELTVSREDGSVISLEAVNVSVRDENGDLSGYLGIHRDMTERKRGDEALREANRRAENILESIGDSFNALDAEWRYTYLNPAALRRIQKIEGHAIALEDLVGKSVWNAFPRLIDTPIDNQLRRAVREQREVSFEIYSAGSEEWLEVRAHPSPDGGLTVYGRDITARKLAQEQLAYNAQLLENMDDAVLGTDQKFVVTAWNHAAERMFGWTADEAVGELVHELIPTSFSAEELAAEMKVLMASGRWRGEASWYGKDGKAVYAEANTVAVRSGEGEVTGYLCIWRDLRERKQIGDELELRVRQQAAVAELGLRALADGHLQRLMQEAATVVCRTLGVDYAKADELLPGGQQLLTRAGAGWADGVVGSATIPAGAGSPSGYALLTGEPVIVDDMASETRFDVPPVLREHDVMSSVSVVIDPHGKPFGVLAAMSKKRSTFSEDDVSFVQAIANVLASAVDRARTEDRLEVAREAERSRIARDLHDEALRELTDALAVATMSRSSTARRTEERRWDALITALLRVSRRLRSAIYDLRLSTQETRGFGDLLADMVALQAELAVAQRLELDGLDALSIRPLGQRGSEALRIVREAITNARRHSDAAVIRIDAGKSSSDVVRIEISDDGAWPNRAATLSSGSRAGAGILSMLERADLLGADLQIEDRPGGGTRVWLELDVAGRDLGS